MPTINDIAAAIEAKAPIPSQQEWDNSGLLITPRGADVECTGVAVCLDVTPAVMAEAIEAGCNMIVSHHPLIFRGIKFFDPSSSAVQDCCMEAILKGVAIYASHTPLDVAPCGPSAWLADALGLSDTRPLEEGGFGMIGTYPGPMRRDMFIELVREVYGGGLRVTPGHTESIRTVALCSGSGSEFIADAIEQGADAFITSDMRYHDLLDNGEKIMLVDTGHYNSEICTKSIFSHIISEKFPNFAVHMCRREHSPVAYYPPKD